MRQYETFELRFHAAPPVGSWVDIDLVATFTHETEVKIIRGFYAGEGTYIVRFYPTRTGLYTWQTAGIIETGGEAVCEPAAPGQHGIVRREGLHFRYDDGRKYLPFGTTVYALLHQDCQLIDRTMASLAVAPFNGDHLVGARRPPDRRQLRTHRFS